MKIFASSKKNVIWGVILLILAIGLIFLVFSPGLTWIAGISVWKWLIGAVLLYWTLDHLIFGKSIREHLDIFLPLGLIFIVFKSNLAEAFYRDLYAIKNWAILGIALLLTAVIHLLFSNTPRIVVSQSTPPSGGGNEDARSHLGHGAVYFDLSEKTSFSASNSMGQTEIYFQNTSVGDPSQPVKLSIENNLGQTVIHVPSDWKVTSRVVTQLGDFTMRPNPNEFTRELVLYGSNHLGNITVRS